METTVSSKYQIVIPKAARKRLGLKPGQKMHIEHVSDTEITLSMPLSAREFFDKYAGTLKGAAWQKNGTDAAEWVRQYRNKDSRPKSL